MTPVAQVQHDIVDFVPVANLFLIVLMWGFLAYLFKLMNQHLKETREDTHHKAKESLLMHRRSTDESV